MKKILIPIIAVVLAGIIVGSFFVIRSCNGKKTDGVIVFDTTISSAFEGLGVEWGVYEDTAKLCDNAESRIYSAVSRLNPALVRCMLNFDWVCTNLDTKGTADLNDDTWDYDFSNKYMINCCSILDYCQNNGIKVALGVWNVIGSADESVDKWGMVKNTTADIRWAKMATDLISYLVKSKGYTCIKWFVSSNEPNYTGAVGLSKNAYNTYEKWEQGVKNVRAAFDKAGLSEIDIIGGDTTGFAGSSEYLPKIAKNMPDTVNNYGVHMYVGNYDIDKGVYGARLGQLYKGVKNTDKDLGVKKSLFIWEAGLLDGKDVATDCNRYIQNYSYGLRMADYTVQSILSGANGIVYWDLDDAMHFMYNETGATAKEWGMFSTLNGASASKQEFRPWYHSSVILTNLLRPSDKIFSASITENPYVSKLQPTDDIESDKITDFKYAQLRTLATVSQDSTRGGIVAVNRDMAATEYTFRIDTPINADGDLYVYIFNEKYTRLDSNGFVVPNVVTKGNLNNGVSVTLPANSMVVVSTERL